VTVILSFATKPPEPEKLKGLVYDAGATKEEDLSPWYSKPEFFALVVIAFFIYLNVKFF
jgi:hypothetical protein